MFDADWTIVNGKMNHSAGLNYYADLVITNIQKDNYVIPEREEIAGKRILEQQVDYSDRNFWKDYNYLTPDRDFDRIFLEIEQRNALRQNLSD